MILDPNEELWRLRKVTEVTGLSKSEIYRQAKATNRLKRMAPHAV